MWLFVSICRCMSLLLLARDHLVYGSFFISGFLEIFLCVLLVYTDLYVSIIRCMNYESVHNVCSAAKLLSHFSHVQLRATPSLAHQALLSLESSRKEHWRGLPFPSPMHEGEKGKWSRPVVSDSVTPWTTAHQAPPSMGFSRQEYWSGLPLPSPVWSARSIEMYFFEDC